MDAFLFSFEPSMLALSTTATESLNAIAFVRKRESLQNRLIATYLSRGRQNNSLFVGTFELNPQIVTNCKTRFGITSPVSKLPPDESVDSQMMLLPFLRFVKVGRVPFDALDEKIGFRHAVGQRVGGRVNAPRLLAAFQVGVRLSARPFPELLVFIDVDGRC